ncbi:MAG: PD40 domain-containing protein, partial [candidate division WOR-3 bacterium]
YESRSLWSPDGQWIAFQTDRWGNDDICVMRANGTEPPERLTYYSTYDALYNWTPDGKSVVFVSPRTTLRPALYRVSIDGGLPQPITRFTAWHVCYTPDGKTLFYERGNTPWWRRKYRGGANEEIWVKTLPDGESEKITDHPGRDGYPMYSAIDKKLYFLSDRGEPSVSNIWRMDIDGKNPEQVTYETEDIHLPEISWDGSLIAYECRGYIYTYNILSGQKKKLHVTVTEDYTENPFTFKVFTSKASEFALSPDEKELAFIVHGDIFVMSLKDNRPDKVARVTNTPYIEKYVSWHPEKEMLIYSSMEDGDMDIYTIEPETEKKLSDDFIFKTSKIIDTDVTEIKALFSPDGEHIAYCKNKEELYVMDRNGKNSRKLCPDNDVLWIDWSPDSKWITFSRKTLGWREDVFVVPADGSKEPINISNHPNDDYKPMWSADGRRIAFASRDAIGNLWMKYVFLRKEDEERDREYWEKTDTDSIEDVSVHIDFQDIEERIHTVAEVSGEYNHVAQSPDGKQFAIYSDNQASKDIWTVDWFGKELKRVTYNNVEPKQFTILRDRKTIYYLLETGNLFSVDIATEKSTPLSFDVEIGIDMLEEREHAFDEAWWALQDGFYDSEFHGTDWKTMYHKYKNRALHTRTTRDFHNIVSLMIGELNASHLGIWKIEGGGERTGELGILYDHEYRGEGVKVKDVIPGSPATEKDVNIRPGDIITHINGTKIIYSDNFYALLRNKSNEKVMLTILMKGKQRNVKVTLRSPLAMINLVETNWVKANKKYVHEMSHGKIGYLYIARMEPEDLRKFEKDLYEEMDKEGLIIDVRYNGGGVIHDEILNILGRTAYSYSMERAGEKTYNMLFWNKPSVVLINEHCYSGGEAFPAGFKALNLGKLVGVPTYGAVIGTNNIELFDGSTFRIPRTGRFMLTGENLENMPVEPDIYVENAPEEDGSSSDHQLTAAIDVLLEQIAE